MLRPMAKKKIELSDIPRNDPGKAIAYAEQEIDAGTFSQEVARVLYLLQDEPDAYARALERWVEGRLKENKAVGPYRPT